MLDLLNFLPEEGNAAYFSRVGVIVISVLLLSFIAFRLILPVLRKAVTKTNHDWDDILIENHFISRMLLIVPVVAADKLTHLLFTLPDEIDKTLGHLISIAITLVIASVVLSVINTIRDIFDKIESLRTLPIDNIRQLAVLLVYLITTIFIVSIIFNKSPLTLLTGISAAMALVLLIFKDVILGFVAGVQLSLNRLVRVGDWIVFEKGNADGDVISVGLTVVKVRNFDKTITSIPVYDLVSNSFTNWRGMQETGARRIKRAIYLDQNSVGYLSQSNYEKLKEHPLLKQYLADKLADGANIASKDELPSHRCLSNLGTFRAYIEAYLKDKKEIRNDILMMCRQLAPTEHGLPLEIYCFTETDWLKYEKIQADVFDHLYCVAKYFGLRVYQFGEIRTQAN